MQHTETNEKSNFKDFFFYKRTIKLPGEIIFADFVGTSIPQIYTPHDITDFITVKHACNKMPRLGDFYFVKRVIRYTRQVYNM